MINIVITLNEKDGKLDAQVQELYQKPVTFREFIHGQFITAVVLAMAGKKPPEVQYHKDCENIVDFLTRVEQDPKSEETWHKYQQIMNADSN